MLRLFIMTNSLFRSYLSNTVSSTLTEWNVCHRSLFEQSLVCIFYIAWISCAKICRRLNLPTKKTWRTSVRLHVVLGTIYRVLLILEDKVNKTLCCGLSRLLLLINLFYLLICWISFVWNHIFLQFLKAGWKVPACVSRGLWWFLL